MRNRARSSLWPDCFVPFHACRAPRRRCAGPEAGTRPTSPSIRSARKSADAELLAEARRPISNPSAASATIFASSRRTTCRSIWRYRSAWPVARLRGDVEAGFSMPSGKQRAARRAAGLLPSRQSDIRRRHLHASRIVASAQAVAGVMEVQILRLMRLDPHHLGRRRRRSRAARRGRAEARALRDRAFDNDPNSPAERPTDSSDEGRTMSSAAPMHLRLLRPGSPSHARVGIQSRRVRALSPIASGPMPAFYESMLARLSNLAIDVPSPYGDGSAPLHPLRGAYDPGAGRSVDRAARRLRRRRRRSHLLSGADRQRRLLADCARAPFDPGAGQADRLSPAARRRRQRLSRLHGRRGFQRRPSRGHARAEHSRAPANCRNSSKPPTCFGARMPMERDEAAADAAAGHQPRAGRPGRPACRSPTST